MSGFKNGWEPDGAQPIFIISLSRFLLFHILDLGY
jgi:hypothetical protein